MNVKIDEDTVLLHNKKKTCLYQDRKILSTGFQKKTFFNRQIKWQSVRSYEVEEPEIKIFRNKQYIDLWSKILNKPVSEMAKRHQELKKHGNIWRLDIDKVWLKSKPISVKTLDLGQFYFRFDMKRPRMVLAKPVRGSGNLIISGPRRSARHPHVYKYTRHSKSYKEQLHVCLGVNDSQVERSVRQGCFIDALECVETMLNNAAIGDGIGTNITRCWVCNDVYIGDKSLPVSLRICDECA